MPEEKPYKPTKRRLDKARRDGKVLKSQQLTQSIVVALLPLLCIYLAGPAWVRMRKLLEYQLTLGFTEPLSAFSAMLEILCEFLFVVLLLGSFLGVVLEGVQIGFRFEGALIAPKLSRLNPIAGVGKTLSSLRQIWTQALRLLFLVTVFIWFFKGNYLAYVKLYFLPLEQALEVGLELLKRLLYVMGVAVMIVGGVDYLLTRRRFVKDLSMSLDELKREQREDEGDPHIKARRKALHEAILMQDIVRRVRSSKVIVVEKM